MRLLLAALLLSASQALACTWLVGTVGSRHFDTDSDFEESNYGLGVEQCLSKDWRLVGGVFRNSLRHDSVYAGASWSLLKAGPIGLSLVMGVASGYEVEPAPILLPVLVIEGERFGANLLLVPKTDYTTAAVGLQVKYRLK